jgi:hypothetical protein
MLKKIENAEAWLNSLQVDPIRLRSQHGMKGKKHFVEWLIGYQSIIDFYRGMPDGISEADRVRAHVLRGLDVLNTPTYHDLGSADNKQFTEDALSYLYACGLAQGFGFDTKFYLSEITKILPRIYAHASSRGAGQRMALIRRLGALCLPATDTMAPLVDKTQIRQRKPAAELLKVHVYLMAHEISHLTDAGQHPPKLLNAEDLLYLSNLLGGLLDPVLEDVDLLSEVVEALANLGMTQNKNFRNALDFIAKQQNENGSFGAYEDERRNLSQQGSLYDVDVGMYLHATTVCLRTLVHVKC